MYASTKFASLFGLIKFTRLIVEMAPNVLSFKVIYDQRRGSHIHISWHAIYIFVTYRGLNIFNDANNQSWNRDLQ